MSDDLEYVDAICIPFPDSGHIAWRYSMCRPHADDFIARSRECGDVGFWHLFSVNSEFGFCQVCEGRRLRPDREPHPFNQIPVHTDYPPDRREADPC